MGKNRKHDTTLKRWLQISLLSSGNSIDAKNISQELDGWIQYWLPILPFKKTFWDNNDLILTKISIFSGWITSDRPDKTDILGYYRALCWTGERRNGKTVSLITEISSQNYKLGYKYTWLERTNNLIKSWNKQVDSGPAILIY